MYEIKNISQKAFIVKPEDVIKGGEIREETEGKKVVYINPNDTVRVSDVLGKKLEDGYPNQVMVISKKKDRDPADDKKAQEPVKDKAKK